MLAVYSAKAYAWEACSGKALPKVSDIESYVSSIFESRWFRREFPGAKGFEILDGRGASYAWGGLVDGICRISLPRVHRFQLIVLHELAHGLGDPNHGPIFCSCYLKLVRRFISPKAASVLQLFFETFGIKHRRPSYEIQWDDEFAYDQFYVGPEPYRAGPKITAVSPPWQKQP